MSLINLTDLDALGDSGITDEGVEKLPKLRKLKAEGNYNITNLIN